MTRKPDAKVIDLGSSPMARARPLSRTRFWNRLRSKNVPSKRKTPLDPQEGRRLFSFLYRNPARDVRKEAERGGLVATARAWIRMRKQMAREERQMARDREAQRGNG